MASERQAYKPLSKEIEQCNYINATAPPPAYDQRQAALQPQMQQITLAPNVHMAANVSAGGQVFNMPVGPSSTEMTCPQCRCRVKSKVRHRSTSKTHIACLLLSWTLCCCCLPYCMDSCRNANHFCPMCGTFLGTYQS